MFYSLIAACLFTTISVENRLDPALQMARDAGHCILAVKESNRLDTQIKNDNTPVTLADHASNRSICETIQRLFPNDGILSEETTPSEADVHAEWTWVIDPLDGTKAFIKSTGQNALNLDPRYTGINYGVHIGLLHRGEPVLGVNYYPEVDTLYYAHNGGAYMQRENGPVLPLMHTPVSGIHPILNPTANEREMVGKIYEKLLGKEEALRFNDEGIFLDSFGYKMISIGMGDKCNLYVAPAGGPGFWDVCSMVPFVQALGGMVTDWQGHPIDFRDMSRSGLLPKGAVISMDADLHAQVIAIIAELDLLH